MQFIVCDDFVEPAVADEFERLMLSNQFPWFFYANVNYGTPPPEGHQSPTLIHDATRFQDSFGFAHLLFPGGPADAPWFAHSMNVLKLFLHKHGLTQKKLLRIKANLLVRSAVPAGPRPFTPHVDMPVPHLAMIYYVNDSDGDTVILDKTYP